MRWREIFGNVRGFLSFNCFHLRGFWKAHDYKTGCRTYITQGALRQCQVYFFLRRLRTTAEAVHLLCGCNVRSLGQPRQAGGSILVGLKYLRGLNAPRHLQYTVYPVHKSHLSARFTLPIRSTQFTLFPRRCIFAFPIITVSCSESSQRPNRRRKFDDISAFVSKQRHWVSSIRIRRYKKTMTKRTTNFFSRTEFFH